jgi:hypothetical protein
MFSFFLFLFSLKFYFFYNSFVLFCVHISFTSVVLLSWSFWDAILLGVHMSSRWSSVFHSRPYVTLYLPSFHGCMYAQRENHHGNLNFNFEYYFYVCSLVAGFFLVSLVVNLARRSLGDIYIQWIDIVVCPELFNPTTETLPWSQEIKQWDLVTYRANASWWIGVDKRIPAHAYTVCLRHRGRAECASVTLVEPEQVDIKIEVIWRIKLSRIQWTRTKTQDPIFRSVIIPFRVQIRAQTGAREQ